MGFKTVYQCLTDLFPQVDSRILKAVAIENSKDADKAVEIVLLEILPYLEKNCSVSSPPSADNSHTDSSDGAEQEEETLVLKHRHSSVGKAIDFSSEPSSVVEEDGGKADLTDGISVVSTNKEEELNPSAPMTALENIDSEQLCRNIESEELILLGNPKIQKSNGQPKLTQALEVFSNAFSPDLIQDIINDSDNLKSKQENKVVLLEEMVEDAKSNKKILFSAMQAVMNMMREVELKEEEAELAIEEAAMGGLDILAKVEELKNILVHAKEANDMHAGEVYGEKAILATELRELQTRLLSLSDERDNALAILDEMHQTLQERLSVVEVMSKAAEREKLEKEGSARDSLAEQEAIMDMVVQESKILQQEAEENSKLREFLIDRGRVVDTLQGEISVICQDIRLLKEKFDERVPLSKSISSSQTSCILASSGSSLKSTQSELALEMVGKSKSSKEASSASSVNSVDNDAESPRSKLKEERIINFDRLHLDDGWQFFEGAEM